VVILKEVDSNDNINLWIKDTVEPILLSFTIINKKTHSVGIHTILIVQGTIPQKISLLKI